MQCDRCYHVNPHSAGACDSCGYPLGKRQPTPPPPTFRQALRHSTPNIRPHWERMRFVLPIAAGLLLIAFGAFYYLSPLTRLRLYGVRMEYRACLQRPVTFLVGFKEQTRPIAIREGRLDTPLADGMAQETGSILLQPEAGSAQPRRVEVHVQEWIKSVQYGEDRTDQTIPPTHPSIAPTTLAFDQQGTLLDRTYMSSPRLGRALVLILPNLPKGVHRKGSSWADRIVWTAVTGEWKVQWQGTFTWEITDTVPCGEHACAVLDYQGELLPQVIAPPEWATNQVESAEFRGSTRGHALYDVKDKMILSNTFSLDGDILIGIKALETIPWEQRIGNATPQGPGTIDIRVQSESDIRSL